ncbi:outer membrane protein assembly factor BamE [Ramlibacter sp. CrO1]|uniref:Outer membrane protein assembly factor BamE n=1 Tax=Ramlibacter algicola TaxID=2795217 RepID=A0A934PW12_9BURK|nr:outer membrane protein assembly factor BamE [Ramlibacter algicola]
MPLNLPSLKSAGALLAACMLAAGCGSVDRVVSRRVTDAITPYKVEIVQGNFVSREQVEALKPGMSRVQVRELLGTPLLADIFHADRWDYVFTMRRQGVPEQQRRLTLYFKGEGLERWEGDQMPAEVEFVATINKRRVAKVPPLEATEEQLQKAGVKPAGTPAPAPVPDLPPPPANYPPLER